jgi:hypothetical protein
VRAGFDAPLIAQRGRRTRLELGHEIPAIEASGNGARALPARAPCVNVKRSREIIGP